MVPYRVFHPYCHTQIFICARIQKKKSELATSLNNVSPGLATPKKWQSSELATPKHNKVLDCAIFL